MKRFFIFLILIFVVAGMVYSGGRGARDSGKTVLRVGSVFPPEDYSTVALNQMARNVYERSGGTLELTVFPAGQLGSAAAQLEMVSMGTLDMALDGTSIQGIYNNDRQMENMFFAFRDAAHYTAFRTSELNRQIEEELLRRTGIRVLTNNWYRGPRSFISRVPFDAQNIDRLIIRVPDVRAYLESIVALGASPVQLAWGEVYLGLMQGVVDAAEGPLDQIYSMRFFEAASYIMLTEHVRDSLAVYINNRVWGRLSPEHQRILVETGIEAGDWYSAQVRAANERVLENFRNAGVTITRINTDPLRERVARRVQEIEAGGAMWRRGLYQELQNLR